MPEASTSSKRTWVADVELTIPFYDLDPLEVVWHGNYAKYFERARCAVLDVVSYNYAEMKASGYAWPVIDMHVRFLQPLTFGQVIVVHAEIVEWEHWLKLHYVIRDKTTGVRLTTGTTRQVAVDLETKLMSLQSPAVLFERLGVLQP